MPVTFRSQILDWMSSTAPTGAVVAFVGIVGLIAAGCGPSGAVSTPETSTRSEKTGNVRFVVPNGWLDFSADSLRPANTWLVRRDFVLSLTFEEIRSTVGTMSPPKHGVKEIAEEVYRLETGAAGVSAADSIRSEEGRGRYAYWSYLLHLRSGEEVRVMLVADGMRMFRCAITRHGGAVGQGDAETQEAFLRTVMW